MAPGAVVVRSDVIRKTLCGVSPTTRLGPEGYRGDLTSRVYQTMAQRAGVALAAGQSVIADAVYARPEDREAIASVARNLGVAFMGFWIDGPELLLAGRLRDRLGDASDATVDVLAQQVRTGVGPLDWQRLEGSGDAESVHRSAERTLRASGLAGFSPTA
jgi:hypothetical protein